MGPCPPTHSSPAAPPIIHPIYRGRKKIGWLLSVAAYWQPFKAQPQHYLYVSMGLVLAPQSTEPAMVRAHWTPQVCYRLIESKGAKIWIHGGCCHGERGSKPLTGRAAAAHVGCCVLWLCFVLWLVVEHCILPIL
jgi:hypothetical protein